MLSSDINFILGKIYHKKENFDEAIKFYFQSVKLNSQNMAA